MKLRSITAIFSGLLLAVVLPAQQPPTAKAEDPGLKIFAERCAKCHDENAAKTLPDGSNLLKRLAANKDPETRLGTRLKDPKERHQVFLYLEPLISRVQAAK